MRRLDYSSQPLPQVRPRWTGTLSLCALLAAGLALLISHGGHHAGFVSGERTRVVIFFGLSTLFIILAMRRLHSERLDGVQVAGIVCGVILVLSLMMIALAAYLCLTARMG